MLRLRLFRYVSITVICFLPLTAAAQRIDSVQVFPRLAQGHYSSASANAEAWQLYRAKGTHRTLSGSQMTEVEGVLEQYQPSTHIFGPLDELTHVAMAFSGGRPVALGVTADLGRVINFTARKEYRISTWSEHVKVRALLVKMLMELDRPFKELLRSPQTSVRWCALPCGT